MCRDAWTSSSNFQYKILTFLISSYLLGIQIIHLKIFKSKWYTYGILFIPIWNKANREKEERGDAFCVLRKKKNFNVYWICACGTNQSCPPFNKGDVHQKNYELHLSCLGRPLCHKVNPHPSYGIRFRNKRSVQWRGMEHRREWINKSFILCYFSSISIVLCIPFEQP